MQAYQTFREIGLHEIRPSPLNPRRITDEHPTLGPMADSIRTVGLIQPIVVRPLGGVQTGGGNPGADAPRLARFEIVAGERRWRACRKAKLPAIAAFVRELDDAQALEVIVVENLQREDLTPLEEAAGVQSLLDAQWDVATVADHLGRPKTWVVKRARLTSLSATWRKQLDKPGGLLREWSATHLELIARLDPAGQDAFYREHAANLEWIGKWTANDLHARLADWTRKLRSAPWKLDDPLILPAAGACTACPKRSSCTPGLFDEETTEEVTKEDRCLDALCWERKLKANAELKYVELKAAHPDLVVIRQGYQTSGKNSFDPELAKSARPDFETTPAKKTDKGAVPAIVVDGPAMGTIRWIQRNSQKTNSKSQRGGTGGKNAGANAAGAQKTLKERREALEKRRRVHATDAIREAIEKATHTPTLEELIPVAIASGLEFVCKEPGGEAIDVMRPPDKYMGHKRTWPWSIVDVLAKVVEKPNWPKYLWAQVKPVLCARLRYANSSVPVGPLWVDAQRSAKLAGLDPQTFFEQACEAIPEPKSWAKLAEEEALSDKIKVLKATKGKRPSLAKAARRNG